MRIGGWKTASMFRRYNVVDERDLTEAAERLTGFPHGCGERAAHHRAARGRSGDPLPQRTSPENVQGRTRTEHGQSGPQRRCISRLNGRKFLIPLSEGWPSQV